MVLPPHHNLDHRALVARIGGEQGGVREYVKERLMTLDGEKTPHTAEQARGEKMFEALKTKVSKPEQREDYENNLIRPGTWVLINQRVVFQKEGHLTMAEG